jgi:hypothetical protein
MPTSEKRLVLAENLAWAAISCTNRDIGGVPLVRCRLELESKTVRPVYCAQGPPPPNPLVVERFQGVVSQLFQQVCVGERLKDRGAADIPIGASNPGDLSL